MADKKILIEGKDIYAPKLIPNVIDTTQSSGKVTCYMYKSESIYAADKKAPFSAYIRGTLEPSAGAHYYARSFMGTTYQSASCTVPLSKCSLSLGGAKRVGYISLGICTEGGSLYHHFDVGLCNRGQGWYPNVWGKDFLLKYNPSGPTTSMPNVIHRDDTAVPIKIEMGESGVTIPASATVTILVEVGRYSTVDWMRATFSYNGKTGKIAINVPRGTLFPDSTAANPTVRFNRFMSLVPDSGYEDIRDNSRMEGWMENLKLGTSNWNAALLQHVWDVQHECLPTIRISTLAGSSGTSNVDHAVIYHSKNA